MDLQLRGMSGVLTLDRPRIMGVLNVTPDSFSDGGRYKSRDTALKHAQAMLDNGADIVDVGGESTRPGAIEVPVQEELDRVIPVIEALKDLTDGVISVDTSKAAVIEAAAEVGIGLINDVRALQESGAANAAAKTGLPVCLMHMKGTPSTMQADPAYEDVLAEVIEFLQQRTQIAVDAGVEQGRILWDPGFGFGKTAKHNLTLLNSIGHLVQHAPVLIGLSRKRLFAEILGDATADRTVASVTAAVLGVQQGASIVRVHDVRQTSDAVKVLRAVQLGDIPG